MEFNNIYIDQNILSIILDNIKNNKDKINFCKCNKDLFNCYYKDLVKLNIFKLNNISYFYFYKMLYKFNYSQNELNNLLKDTIIYLSNTWKREGYIWVSQTCGVLDLRFIFEVQVKGGIIDDSKVEKLYESFYNYGYKYLKKFIVKNDRKSSIYNVQRSHCTTLYYNFKPFLKNKNSKNFISIINANI